MFVRTKDPKLEGSAIKYIEKVRYGLHPTFGAEYQDVRASEQNKNFEMTFIGWGTFEIPVTIFLRKGFHEKQITVSHYLNFS